MVVSRIAPAESDLAIAEGDQAVVGDGHAMSVAAEIVHHVLGATEGTFQVHHPILSMEGPQPSGEGLRLRQKLQVSVEVELAILKRLFERVDELAAKNFLQHVLGQEVIVSGTNPAGVMGRETAGRNDTVHMWMSGEFLAPGMQDAEEADLCAEVSGIASDFEEGFRTGAEQEIIDDLFVLQYHRRQATRQGEDHMEIARGEKLLLTRGDPAVPSGGLTLRAVAIATAVIGDG